MGEIRIDRDRYYIVLAAVKLIPNRLILLPYVELYIPSPGKRHVLVQISIGWLNYHAKAGFLLKKRKNHREE